MTFPPGKWPLGVPVQQREAREGRVEGICFVGAGLVKAEVLCGVLGRRELGGSRKALNFRVRT